MRYKYCQNCGKKIPVTAKFCLFCGSPQSPKSRFVTHRSRDQVQAQSQPASGNASLPPLLTSTDIEMLIINGICAFLQFLYSIQALLPVMNASTEMAICLVAALLGIVISGIDGYENFENRLPIWSSLLGIAGNLVGPGLAYVTGLKVITVLGTVIIGFGIYLVYREIR